MTEHADKLDLHSDDIADGRRKELVRLFPEVGTEGGKLDFDRLKLALGEAVDAGKERYGMNWPGKVECFKNIQMPSLGTLRPCPQESLAFETTSNLIIEGDNLEVLKLLQKSYLGKVKMIYIDPPYNTGSDFIYPDNYAESLHTYLQYTGQADAEGKRFGTNTEAAGRFHSRWLNMMYPRLYLARNLLRPDGVIFISIDEKEGANLRTLCNEIFGEENHVEDLVWAQNTTHSQSPLYSTNHEYVLCYARDLEALQEHQDGGVREAKPGYRELNELVSGLNRRYPSISEVETAIANLFNEHRSAYGRDAVAAGLSEEEAAKQDPWRGLYPYKYAEYRDENGAPVKERSAAKRMARLMVWQGADGSAPAAKQSASTKDPKSPNFRFFRPRHPVTGKPCPHPKTGWRWPKTWPDSSRESFASLDSEGRIAWGVDETTVPRFKRFLDEVETNVAKSFFYDYTDGEKQVAELLGEAALFPNPKPTTLVARFLNQICRDDDLVLDFFAGSGTTGQAVLDENASSGSRLRFILVQLPEPIDPTNKDEEAAAKFCDKLHKPRTIAEITKERVRRAINRLNEGNSNLLDLNGLKTQDRGFRAFALAESSFRTWDAGESRDAAALAKQLELHVDHIRKGRTADDLLYEILLKSGFPLNTPVESLVLAGKTVRSVAGGALLVCLERELTLELIGAIAERKPERVVCLDDGFAANDQLKANTAQLFRTKGIGSFKTV